MAFQYENVFPRVKGTPEKRVQKDLQRVALPIQRKLLSKVLNFLERI